MSNKPSNPKDQIATDKLALNLVSPIVKAYQSISHFLGMVKYGAWNWRAAGARASIYKSALDRHLDAWWEGEENDPVDGTPHLANALACIGILIDAKHAGKLIDDRPPSQHTELAKVRSEFEALMPKIRERYADKAPKHYTIADTLVPVAEPLPYCACTTHCSGKQHPDGPELKCRNLPGEDGWLPWDGRGRPVDLSFYVDVRLRNGEVHEFQESSNIRWRHISEFTAEPGRSTDVIAYRLSPMIISQSEGLCGQSHGG